MESNHPPTQARPRAPFTHKVIAAALVALVVFQVVGFYARKAAQGPESVLQEAALDSGAVEQDSGQEQIRHVPNESRVRMFPTNLGPVRFSQSHTVTPVRPKVVEAKAAIASRPPPLTSQELATVTPPVVAVPVPLPMPVTSFDTKEITVGLGENIRGFVFLQEPAPQQVRPPREVKCGNEIINDRLPSHYRVGEDGVLADALVFIESGPSIDGLVFELPQDPVELEISHCLFSSYIMAARVGQSLRIHNRSSGMHAVGIVHPGVTNQSFTPILEGRVVDITVKQDRLFQRVEDALQPANVAWVSGFRHPWFAVTDDLGTFILPGLSAGSHVMVVSHRKLGSLRVTLRARKYGGGGIIPFALPVPESLRDSSANVRGSSSVTESSNQGR